VTLKVRGLVQAGEQLGPTIITAGTALYPPEGLPYYLKRSIPRPLQWLMPQPETPEAARRAVVTNVSRGADLLKLFTGSWVERGHVKPMPLEVARAAVEQAHALGALAFAHPSNLEGTQVALEAGVDVLAHAPDATLGIDDALLASLVAHHVAMVPTLKMFATTVKTDPAYLAPIHAVVRRFHALGGTLLFGTDVGYMTDPDTTDEFVALADCGLSFAEVLAMLTTAPATRFAGKPSGTVEVGSLADLVLFETDPSRALTTLAHPLATVRAGRLTFSR
jgi:imidazolonepropionase-like amidohydrolase